MGVGALRRLLRVDPYGNLFEDRPAARIRKLLSPRWIRDRIALTIYERTHPDEPWITRDAVRWMDRALDGSQRGLEWGSGAGTLWLARRSQSVVSVEHHREWHAEVTRRLERGGVRHVVDYKLVSDHPEAYVAPIAEIADEALDWVLVDGLHRDEAFSRSMSKVKPGGFIVFDNVNWSLPSDSRTPHSRSRRDGPASPLWGEVDERLSAERWTRTWTTNGVNDTAIFHKPSAR